MSDPLLIRRVKASAAGTVLLALVLLCVGAACGTGDNARADRPQTATSDPSAAVTGRTTTPDGPRRAGFEDHLYAPFARVLSTYVDDEGLVGYGNLQRNGRGDLEAFMDTLASFDPHSLHTDAERIAFWINAYNAVVIWQVVQRYPIRSVRDVGALFGLVGGFFKKEYPIAGRQMHADNIEHDTLRAHFSDTRIHWALVCGAFGCPRLIRRPYVAADLDEVLTERAREFLSLPRALRLDREQHTLHLSKYFDWYAEDFESDAGNIIDYVLRYAPVAESEFIREHRDDLNIDYIQYDWTLNDRSNGPRSHRPIVE